MGVVEGKKVVQEGAAGIGVCLGNGHAPRMNGILYYRP